MMNSRARKSTMNTIPQSASERGQTVAEILAAAARTAPLTSGIGTVRGSAPGCRIRSSAVTTRL